MTAGTFFDRQHTAEELELPLLFRLLRRFEVRRVDVAVRLLPPGEALLDIGCGDGELARRVANRYTRVVATDVAPAAVAGAEHALEGFTFRDRIRFLVLDANQKLPFGDGEFDALVALSTLQYVFDPEAFLVEAFRVIRPGGHLLIEVPNMAFLPQRVRLFLGRPLRTSYWRHGIDGGNLHYFTVTLLRRLLRSARFEIETITGSGIFSAVRTWWVALLCGNILALGRRTEGPRIP